MLSDNITKLRMQRSLTQKELAERCGVSITAIKDWESNKHEPKASNLLCLSRIFGVTVDDLLGLDLHDYIYVGDLENDERNAIIQIAQVMINRKHK